MGASMAGSLRRAGCDVRVCDAREGVAAAFASHAQADPTARMVGGMLVNTGGMTLCTFDRDAAGSGKSVCNGPCAAIAAARSAGASRARARAPRCWRRCSTSRCRCACRSSRALCRGRGEASPPGC
jgi:hypothetical protein